MADRVYIAIDLKSFYASAECVERGLDPLRTNLVVADESRTDKTICLAVSPSLKAYGIPGRARLFEVNRQMETVNRQRMNALRGGGFTAASYDAEALARHLDWKADFLIARPQMAHYMEISTKIYKIYLNYVSSEDIHVYSIDEVFMDVTHYLNLHGAAPRELAMRIILDVLKQTGITATAGIGTNLYLCKIAMDIQAKHIQPNANGVRVAELDERRYREMLWDHRPLRDFWRVGKGIAAKLEKHYMFTMGDVARMSIGNEELLYRLFGVNAELLIDHAWGWEPCTIADIKAYRPENGSLSEGQVLAEPYAYEKAALIVREMAEGLALRLAEKGLTTDRVDLTVVYDTGNLRDENIRRQQFLAVEKDYYGRNAPKKAHGFRDLGRHTNSAKAITNAMTELYAAITDRFLFVRRIYVAACDTAEAGTEETQLDMFTDYEQLEREEAEERNLRQTMLEIRKKYGKNAILKGMNLLEGATARERNGQVGGHRA